MVSLRNADNAVRNFTSQNVEFVTNKKIKKFNSSTLVKLKSTNHEEELQISHYVILLGYSVSLPVDAFSQLDRQLS